MRIPASGARPGTGGRPSFVDALGHGGLLGQVEGRTTAETRGRCGRASDREPIHWSQPRRAAWAAAWKRVSAPSSAIRRWIRRWVVR